ncbi:MAG: TIGR00282 family metallophosphoesterase [Bacillota bacterium]|nr:TIGR00282 family metallophosphoesterase [Bacillota bacterium]
MNVLMIGDIVGRPGRTAVIKLVNQLKIEYKIDLVVANGENAAGGNGITKEIYEELLEVGIDVVTMGNHVWDKKEIMSFISAADKLVRPANYPVGTPGQGYKIVTAKSGEKLGVINLSGRVFLSNLECPFTQVNKIVTEIKRITPNILIDFHAEATSEKVAFGWYMDGRVSAVCGTHTHIQTADARILPNGTAYITDVGMTGPRDSVLGVKKELVINKFITHLPVRFEVASGPAQLNGVVVMIDSQTGKAHNIQIIQKYIEN